jgi:hypothetical protein
MAAKQIVCYHREAVVARGRAAVPGTTKATSVKKVVGASCGKALRDGKCPTHGTDIKDRKAIGS